MLYIEKLVKKVAAGNSGVIVQIIGIADDGEVKIVKTSKNANVYRLMVKHGLVECWMSNVHHYKVDKALHEIVGEWASDAEEAMSLLCEAGDYMVGLVKYGVGEDRARHLAEDYLATA